MELQTLEVFVGGLVDMGEGLGVVGVDGQEHFEAGKGGADLAGPAADAVEVRGFGGDGADDGTVDSGAVHGGDQGGRASVGEGLDVAFLFEEGDGLGGEGVLKGVRVEIDDHGGGPTC